MDFKVGETVYLKSGGVGMVIVKIDMDHKTGNTYAVHTNWMDTIDHLQSASFIPDVIEFGNG
jgi:uncharacterized protein YodC (DUF2158 family)